MFATYNEKHNAYFLSTLLLNIWLKNINMFVVVYRINIQFVIGFLQHEIGHQLHTFCVQRLLLDKPTGLMLPSCAVGNLILSSCELEITRALCCESGLRW